METKILTKLQISMLKDNFWGFFLDLLKGKNSWLGGRLRAVDRAWRWTGSSLAWNYTNWRTCKYRHVVQYQFLTKILTSNVLQSYQFLCCRNRKYLVTQNQYC